MTTATELPLNDFHVLGDDRYQLIVPYLDATLDVDRLRRERNQLICELSVRCALQGASTVDGVLSVAEMNLSSVRAREDRARYLTRRARTDTAVDWLGIVEELSQRVLSAERRGTPSVELASIPRPSPDDMLTVDGLTLPRRHSSIIFGDGGTAKSYLTLYALGLLAREGFRVALFDWELAGDDHRDRLERLFGADMPTIHYARCDRPLVSEVDRLRRIRLEERIDFAAFDSVAFACDGPPEAAEVAGRYFRAVRQIGPIGSLHVAHVSKADGSDQKPFGSAFWHNGARSTWYAKLAEATPDGATIQLGLFNRKANLGPLRSSVGFEIGFSEDDTVFKSIELSGVPDLARSLTLPQRIRGYLRSGARTREEIAAEFEDVKRETLKRSINRAIKAGQLIRFPSTEGEQIGVAR